jgi:hypothetical protein
MEVYGGGYGDIYKALGSVVPAGVTVAWIHHFWADQSARYIYPVGAPAKPVEPKKCRCDIRDLMSVGHNAGCPESPKNRKSKKTYNPTSVTITIDGKPCVPCDADIYAFDKTGAPIIGPHGSPLTQAELADYSDNKAYVMPSPIRILDYTV